MKRIIVCIMLIFSLSFFYGFSFNKDVNFDNFIMLSLDFSSNGQIVQSIDFSVESEKINNISTSLKESLDFKNNLIKKVETIRNEFLFTFALTYMANPNEEYKINKGVLLTAVLFDENSDTVGFKIGFENVDAWNYYYSSAKEENTTQKEEKSHIKRNIFLNKIESKGAFPFSSTLKINQNQTILVGERYKQLYISSAENLSFYESIKKEYNPTLIYNYSTFNNRLRSDAEFLYTDNINHVHHIWSVKSDDLNKQGNISLYYYSVEKGIWLIFTLIISLAGMFLTIFIIKIKEKVQNNKRLPK